MAAADVSGRCLFMVVGLCFGALLTWHRQSPAAEFSSTSHSDITKQLKRMKLHGHKSVVLLTGAAGFVGFHTATELTRRGHAVIGLDNFNHYYDVRLKRERQAKLKQVRPRSLRLSSRRLTLTPTLTLTLTLTPALILTRTLTLIRRAWSRSSRATCVTASCCGASSARGASPG